jgi:broad specificity phosphatase PhoE
VSGGRRQVVLIRHGETEWSASGRHTGRTDLPLTHAGRHQAALVNARLVGATWALVLTSPLQRAMDTCRLAGLGAEAEIDPDLREWDYGDYEGLTTPDIHAAQPDWWLWTDGCPGGEQPADVGARCDRVIERCRQAGGDGDVALFAHGHILRALGARWVGAPTQLGGSLLLSTASVSVLGWDRDVPALSRWNDTGHLDPTLALRQDPGEVASEE